MVGVAGQVQLQALFPAGRRDRFGRRPGVGRAVEHNALPLQAGQPVADRRKVEVEGRQPVPRRDKRGNDRANALGYEQDGGIAGPVDAGERVLGIL